MSESWLPIPGYPGYEVSDMGRVRSFKKKFSAELVDTPRVLSPALDKRSGYLMVGLRANGKYYSRKIHQLVALAFIGPRPKGQEVCHGPNGCSDNSLSNLRYDTHLANIQDAARSGNMGKALTPERATAALELASRGKTPKAIANALGVSSSTIKFLLRGQTYKYLPGERVSAMERIQQRASRIRQAYATGYYTMTELAKEEGMDLSSISLIINNKRCIETGKEQSL